ncbi:hypothetical protein WMY93_017372 [Mugilogobius chulae]|uniref:CCDC144C-like coiled-coil domain-containing protein n=1 Tax=Mugilogobius chulae TaxID=88201 RepID=A0AAW0NY60_9GOBI
MREENNQLKSSLQTQEVQAISSRQGPYKKEKQKNEDLLKELKKKDEECKSLTRKINVQTCTIRDLRKNSSQTENQEAICQCEKSFQELEDLKKTQNQLQEQLKRAENDASFFKNQLDIFFNEREEILSDTNRLRATTNQYVVTNKDLRDENCRLHEKYQREIKVLREQLRKEQQKSGNLQASLSKTQHETAQMKELESLVEDLKLKFNEEKSEKEKGQDQVRNLEQTLGKERELFRETVKKCFAAYQRS